MGIRVLKFGGTSVATAGRLRTAAEIVAEAALAGRAAVVVSALAGVTDALAAAAEDAPRRALDRGRLLSELRERHLDLLADLATRDDGQAAEAAVRDELRKVGELLAG